MTDTITAARVGVTNPTYPASLRPGGSMHSAFWTGSDEDRTFFVVETDDHLALVLADTDHRSLYMRGSESMDENEKAALSAAGLNPYGHKVWTIDREYVAFVEQTTMTPEMEETLRSEVPMLALGVGESVSDEVLRNLRGVLFQRFGRDGSLWVTHGDGTATQIVGDPIDPAGRRMGVGVRHETHVPDNCWVSDGWTYAGFDTKRVPEDSPPMEERSTQEIVDSLVKERDEALAEVAALKSEATTGPREIADAHTIVTGLEAEVERLKAEVQSTMTALRESNERVQTATSQHQSDIDKIGERLLEECESRDWCEEFDNIIDELNNHLNRSLPNMCREKEYEVQMRVEFIVTKTVTAASEEDAANAASEDVSYSDVQYELVDDVTVINTEEA